MADIVIVAADDRFQDMLKDLGKKLKVDVITHQKGANPCAVVHDGIEHAKAKNINKVVFFVSPDVDIDQLGRILGGLK